MAYGLQCWDASGNLTLDTTGRYCRLRYSTVVNSDGSINLPDISGKNTAQWGDPLNNNTTGGPIVTRSGTTISWTLQVSGSVLILVFLYT